jgi:hypothetical protein
MSRNRGAHFNWEKRRVNRDRALRIIQLINMLLTKVQLFDLADQVLGKRSSVTLT